MVRSGILALGLCGILAVSAVGGEIVEPEAVDRLAPDFVSASLLVCGRGDSLYSCAGHVAIRLTCHHHQLDEVFSCEGESIEHQVLRFFAGRLRMGMFAIPYPEFAAHYKEEGRGVWEYPLALSSAAKIRLWKLMDDRVAEGANLPYDCIRRGCAQTALKNLLLAIAPEPAALVERPAVLDQTRREILHDYIADYPWTRLLLYLITGPESDYSASLVDSVVTPPALRGYLQGLRVKGEPIIVGGPIELLPQARRASGCGWFLPPTACAIVLLLSVVVGCFRFRRSIVAVLLMLQAALAIFETYVGVFSSLPAAAWNILLIPFNPLPFVFWRWRRWWSRPFAVVLAVWSIALLLAPHRLTDPAMVILVQAYVMLYGCRRFLI